MPPPPPPAAPGRPGLATLALSLALFALLLRGELDAAFARPSSSSSSSQLSTPPLRGGRRRTAAAASFAGLNASAGGLNATPPARWRRRLIPRLRDRWPRGPELLERWAMPDEPFGERALDPLPCGGDGSASAREAPKEDCPWYREGATGDEWSPPARCNPYSRLCSCLAQWLPEQGDPCRDAPPAAAAAAGADRGLAAAAAALPQPARPRVRLSVTGWLNQWPYEAGLRSCERSFCEVLHGGGNRSDVDAFVYSVLNPEGNVFHSYERALVGVAFESALRFSSLDFAAFPYYFDTGVGYKRGLMEMHASYSNYWPAQFRSRGAPFAKKRNPLLTLISNCDAEPRKSIVEALGALLTVDSLGPCRRSAEFAAVLPQCAGLPRSGRTVWLESECLLHHYKFYLAVENTREPDYVTEKLWQGLRAGAVPVYLGAQNVRLFLPEGAAVFVDDFATLADLAAYLKRASADEALYARHHVWKGLPFPGNFVNAVIARPMDGLLCQICDKIAPEIGRTFGPLPSGAAGLSVTLPPCIARMLVAGEFAILRDWAVAAPGWRTPGLERILRTYVLSVRSAQDRQAFMHRQLMELGLGADYVPAFDNEGAMTGQDLFCWQPRSRVDGRPPVHREISLNELSLSMKHVAAAWDIFRSGIEFGLVLEDDAEFTYTFGVSLAASIAEAPPGWDFIFIGGCYNLQAVYWQGVKITDKLWKIPRSRCTHAYLMSLKGALLLLESLPLRFTIDYQISDALGSPDLYWVEAAEAYQSKNFSSLIGKRSEMASVV